MREGNHLDGLLQPEKLPWRHTGDEIFFHIAHAVRNPHGEQPPALPGLYRAVLVGETQRAGTNHRGAFEQPGRGYAGSETANLGKLGEQIQIVGARKAVSTERDINTGGVELLDRR